MYPTGSVRDGRGCVDVPASTAPYGAAITQQLPVQAGQAYELSFTILGDPATQGQLRVVLQGGPDVDYEQFVPAVEPALTPEPATYTYAFTPTRDYDQAELAFQHVGTGPNEAYRVCVDDVSVRGGVELPPSGVQPGPRVNQAAYLPGGPKGATVVTDAVEPLPWQVLDAGGAVVASGTTTPAGTDPTVGAAVHTVDLSALTAPGEGYTLVADGEVSRPFSVGSQAYEQLRTDAMTFFHTNRSGIAISEDLVPGYGRAAGHVGVAPNTGDTAVPCQDLADTSQLLLDEPWTCEGTRDVSGGWYDAGDHGKYVVNGGIAVAQLLQTYERSLHAPSADRDALADGTLAIPERANGVPDVLDEARWELEWMLRMQVPRGQEYAGMANHKVADVDWTGLPLDPAADPQRRVLFRPSTAATLNLAAAAAQGARLWAAYDQPFARDLLRAAETAYAAALAEPALHAPAPDPALDPNAGSGPYDDDDATDEFYWAAAELYLTTGTDGYRDAVLASPHHTAEVFVPGGFFWRDTAALGRIDLAVVPNALPDRDRVRDSLLAGADGYLAAQAEQPFGQAYAPDDGDYSWGSNSSVLNNVVVLGYAYDLSGDATYRTAALRSMDYLFGRNALDLSYVTGYGDEYAQNQHSRWYAASLDPTLPRPPDGTIAGGPNSTAADTGDPVAATQLRGCAAQTCYLDDIGSWSTNEITVNWNAPMAWVASWVADQDEGGDVAYADCTTVARVLGNPRNLRTQVTYTSTADTAVRPGSLRWALPTAGRVERPRQAGLEQDGPWLTADGGRWDRPLRPGSTVRVAYSTAPTSGFAPVAPEQFWAGDGLPCRAAPVP